MRVRKLLLIVHLILLAGCSATSQIPTSTSISQQTATLIPTHTTVPPTLTPISTLTPTTTPIPPPTWTSLPTLVDQNDFLDFISFAGNSICKFPCWAGIVPGRTSWGEAIFALQPISSIAELDILPDQESKYGQVNTISWYLYGGDFRAEGRFLTGNNISLIRMNMESFSVSTPSYSVPLPRQLNLQNVLKEYGVPSMVFIYTFIHDQPGPLPFQILLIYTEYQFHIEYHRDAKLIGDNIVACDFDYYLKLAVLDNKDKLSSIDSINNAIETNELGIQNMKPVEQILNISLEKFYEAYSTSSPGCITFPAKSWSP